MSEKRLQCRGINITTVGSAKLLSHKLIFHKVSIDGSGKCDIYYTNNNLDITYGVVFQIHEKDKNLLDSIEGKGSGYEEKNITVYLINSEKPLEVFTYYATNIDDSLIPYCWYKKHVLLGAENNHLPEDYIEYIKNIPCNKDPDNNREVKELSIYKSNCKNK